MARERKIHKDDRAKRDAPRMAKRPENLLDPPHKMSPDELERQRQRARQAGVMGKSPQASRDRQRKRLDRNDQW